MTNSSFYLRVLYTASVAGLMSALAAHPPSAQGVTDIVRGLNAVINPGDAQRLEDQARRNNRPAGGSPVEGQSTFRSVLTGIALNASRTCRVSLRPKRSR